AVALLPTPPATAQLYPLSLHDALPIWRLAFRFDQHVSTATDVFDHIRLPQLEWQVLPAQYQARWAIGALDGGSPRGNGFHCVTRSEEHTSELQSRENLVCRLLLEKKNP